MLTNYFQFFDPSKYFYHLANYQFLGSQNFDNQEMSNLKNFSNKI